MKLISPLQRRILDYLRPYLFPHLTLLVVTTLLLSASNGAIPLIARPFINSLSKFHDLRQLHLLSIEILILFVVRALANFASTYLNAYVGQRITLNLRSQLNDRLQRLSLSFFNRTPTGVMVSRVLYDVHLIAGSTTDGVFSIFGDGCSLIAVLSVAFYIDWKLALIAFVVFPAAVLPVMGFSQRIRKMTKRSQKQFSGLTVVLQETFQGNRVVKAFGMEDYERRRFDIELRRLLRVNMRIVLIRAITSPMIEVMGAFAIVGVLWFGASSVVAGTRSAGTFGAFVASMLIIYQPFKRLTRTNNTIQQGMAAAERVFEMMDEPIEVPELPNAIKLPRTHHSIELRKVNFRYRKDWVLKEVDLRIGAGEVIALVGMSGGGKSTIADLIPRFYDPQEGQVLIDGVDLRHVSLASLRSQIGLVTQHTFLFNDTIRANIAYGSQEKSEDEIVTAARRANAHGFIARLPQGYDTLVGEMGVRLSGGERQRIAIARALLKDAPILILDEATSSLDSEAERLVQEALELLIANRTVLVIAHRLSTIRRADRIAVLVHGKVIEQGTHDELIALGREYRKLYDLQFRESATVAGNGQLAG
ncbi:MAG: ATP-binding cassette domain-containing protein [Candidatus Binataceae bacterium]|nr:ATP-binding cassette domain-containing protein [Candidatus Binataceae bacterium]